MWEKYRPIIKHIKGTYNYWADTLIRLPLINSDIIEIEITREILANSYSVHKLDNNTLPLTYQKIATNQRKDKELVSKLKCKN